MPFPSSPVTGRDDPAFWRPLVESATDIMYRADQTGRFTYANPAALWVTGYAEAELVGMHFTDLVRADFREQLVHQYARQVSERIPNTYFEFPILTRDGHEVWLGQNLQLTVRDGLTVGVQAIARDITLQRSVEDALRESEERFRLVVENLGEGLLITDLDDVIVYANPRIAQITGFVPTELVGRRASELLLPGGEGAPHLLGEAGRESRVEVLHRRKDGSSAWLEVHSVPYRDNAGTVAGMLALVEDITERKRAGEALRRSEERFRLAARATQDLIYDYDVTTGAIVWNEAMHEVFGHDPSVAYSDLDWWEQNVHPEDRARATQSLRRAIEGTSEFWTEEYRLRRGDGSYAVVLGRGYVIRDSAGRAVRMIGSVADLTALRSAEEESLRLAALSRENPNPVLLCDASGLPLHVNPAAEQVSREIGQADVRGLLPPSHEMLIRTALSDGHSIQQVETSVAGRIFSWTYRPDQKAAMVYLFAVDITGRRLMEEQLRHDALHDALTGLPNRLLFMERLAHAIALAKRREQYLFAVLFLDLDRFKVINDSLGHHVGDELLVLISQRLQRCLRTEDTVARLGGDEFAILLEDITGISDATRVAERIQAELSASINLSGMDVFTSASIGIALSSSAYTRPEYLLRNADMAMYRAKAAGQARFEVFDRAMHAHALARLQLETDLRRALEREEFVLYYQPIVALETGRICGLEALIRWAHPDRGLLLPDEFIPVAEETGLILPVGRWVLREACRQGRALRDRFGDRTVQSVAVNLSAKQFSQPDLVEQIASAVAETGFAVDALQLEITESAVMENADAAVMLLGRLKALGARISMDDFGTGYSSLSYLHRFPLDSLKIDRSFIGRLDSDPRTSQLVQTVLTLAGSLGVSAVAEGIETAEHLAVLRELHCAFGQGHHFALPLPAEELERLLAAQGQSE